MKIDFKKELKEYYNPSAIEISTVNVPIMNYLIIDGQGDPNKSQEYQEAIEALFSISFAMKFAIKKNQEIDYSVMPLEGLWWSEDEDFNIENKSSWNWSSMIVQPEYVNHTLFENVLAETKKKKELVALNKIRWEAYHEGVVAQVMHIGPYSAEGPTIERLHKFIKEKGFSLRGKHHEIYLSDPRRAKPEKLKTIIRQPIL